MPVTRDQKPGLRGPLARGTAHVGIHHDDVLDAVHEPVRDGIEQDRRGLPGHEVPEEIAGPDEEVLDGVDGSARGHDPAQVQGVDDQIPDQHDLADREQPVHEARRHRHVHPVQLPDPQEAEHGCADEHVSVQHAVQAEVEAARRGEPGARFEVVDAREPVLLHEAVLMVPGGDQQQQGDGRELQTHDGEADDHDGARDEAVPEALPDVGHAVGAHPSRVVVGDRDPQVDRRHRHVRKPRLEAQRHRDGEEGQAEEPDDVRSAIQNVARLEHAVHVGSRAWQQVPPKMFPVPASRQSGGDVHG